MFLKNKNINFKIRRSKVTDYAALSIALGMRFHILCNIWVCIVKFLVLL